MIFLDLLLRKYMDDMSCKKPFKSLRPATCCLWWRKLRVFSNDFLAWDFSCTPKSKRESVTWQIHPRFNGSERRENLHSVLCVFIISVQKILSSFLCLVKVSLKRIWSLLKEVTKCLCCSLYSYMFDYNDNCPLFCYIWN